MTPAERSVCLDADVDMASLYTGSVNYHRGVYVNSPSNIEYWAETMAARKVKPNVVFEAGMITNAVSLIERGWIDAPYYFTFVVGQEGAMAATAKNLLFLKESLPVGSIWGVVGHGGSDLTLSVLAMTMGGHVRAGFEDNPYYRPGELARSNAQLIERLVRIADEFGLTPATPAEAREMLGLKPVGWGGERS